MAAFLGMKLDEVLALGRSGHETAVGWHQAHRIAGTDGNRKKVEQPRLKPIEEQFNNNRTTDQKIAANSTPD